MNGSKNELPVIAWDSCVFLAWFKKETGKPLGDIRLVIGEVESAEVALYVSVISYTEVLDTASSSDAGTLFRDFMKRSNVVPLNVDPRIAEKAAILRQKTIAQNAIDKSVPKIKTPDALIVATAILYRVKELHTFDPDMLALSGHEIVSGLTIVHPRGLGGERLLIQDEAEIEEDSENSQ